MEGLTLDEAVRQITTTNPIFAVTSADIRGTRYRVFQHVPIHMRALLDVSRDAHNNGSAEYLVFESERWTFDEFRDDVNRMARVLTEAFGVSKGDPVALAMRNCPEFLIVMMAAASIGAVTVCLNAWWTTEELDYALNDSRAKLVFADGDRFARLSTLVADLSLKIVGVRDGEPLADTKYSDFCSGIDHFPAAETPIDADDDFAIMYSSGTTGHPKGVVLTHRGAINAVYTWLMQAAMAPLIKPPAADFPPKARPSVLIVTPLFHITATHPMFLLSLPAGAKLAVMAKWDAETAVRIIRDEEITRFLGVPTQSADLMEAAQRMGEALPSLEFLGSGGAKRPAAQVAHLARVFPKAEIATGWGMTETNANGIGMAGLDYVSHPSSAGRLYPPVQELRFINDSGDDVRVGEIGEITVKSPCNMRFYLNKPEATAAALKDGWLRTGDLGFIDTDGFVTIVDRKKNIIIRGGENIACLDVEGALHRHPAVAEACAFGVPDERLGEVVGAAVHMAPRRQATVNELKSFLREHIAHFKVPEYIWFQDAPLPRGATDKIDRRALRKICLTSDSKRRNVNTGT